MTPTPSAGDLLEQLRNPVGDVTDRTAYLLCEAADLIERLMKERDLANNHRILAEDAWASAWEEAAKIAKAVTVSSKGHPQIDAPTPYDMKMAIVKALEDRAAAKTGRGE